MKAILLVVLLLALFFGAEALRIKGDSSPPPKDKFITDDPYFDHKF